MIDEKEYCKICGAELKAKDTTFNIYKICLECLTKDKLESIKEQIKKRKIL